MKRFISIFLILCIVFCSGISAFAVEEGALPGDYEYCNEEERDFVENVLGNPDYREFNDTSVFEGHKTYLLQEGFVEARNTSYTGNWGAQCMPAGWNVDRRGGGIHTDNKSLHILDSSEKYRNYMTHDLMPHTNGDLTVETGITMHDAHKDGFFIELKGNGATVLRLETKGQNICTLSPNGTLAPVTSYQPDVFTPIKVIVHPEEKKFDIVVGDKVKNSISYAEDADVIDNISIGTSEENKMYVRLHFVHVYINYIVNERFLTTSPGKIPYDWEMSYDSIRGTGTVETQAQRSDFNSCTLSTSSILAIPRLTKNYKNTSKKTITEFYMLIPSKHDGIEARILSNGNTAISVGVKGEDFAINNNKVFYEDFRTNLWYRFKVITNTETNTADVYLNFVKYAENVPLLTTGTINGIQFTSGRIKGASMTLDDINVYPDLPLPTGYPEEPRTVEPDKNIREVGMLMYSMWREGFHFGWDRLSPLEERTPYQGYYTEGEGETADWAIKWQKEHGITYQIYTWSGVERTEDVPVKKPVRSQAWLEGLHNAKFDMEYCLMWSTPSTKSIRGLEDFKNNILPYWVEFCWKNPRYKRIDNKILLYTYSTGAIRDYLGGPEAMAEAVRLMNEEARKIGADGVLFVACVGQNFSNEDAEKIGAARYSYGWGGGSASDAEIVKTGIRDYMEKGELKDYVPSIPMGYEDSPWRTAGIGGFMTINEIKDILTYVNDNSDKWKDMGNNRTDMVVLTCWDEWGEGHFYCPSKTHGFGYMNAIRESLTTKGPLKDEKLPSKQSYARMNVLYPMGRQSLKLLKDMRETDQVDPGNMDNLKLMQKIDFSTPEDFARAEIEKNADNLRQENGMLAFNCLGRDPSVFVNNLNIPAKRVAAVRITAQQPIAGTNTLFFQTTVDPNMGVNAKRFQGVLNSGSVMSAMLFPANDNRLQGNITRFRIDPPDETEGTMYVKSIEIFESKNPKISVEFDGQHYDPTEPVVIKDGTKYLSIYQYFHGKLLLPCYWYRNEGRLHIEYNDKVIELYNGKKEYTIDGVSKSFSVPAYYNDGDFFVPIEEFFSEIGYKINWNEEALTYSICSPEYLETASVPADIAGEWNFNRNNDLQGWLVGKHAPLSMVKNGCLEYNVLSHTIENVVENLALDVKDYTKLVIRMKNASDANTLRFFYRSDKVSAFGSPNRMIFNISSNDTSFKEYTINLSEVPNFGGIISALRIDFTGGTDGTIFIDSICFE